MSIIVQFRVVDPTAALHEVQDCEERIYSDVQLAARRSLASMILGEILTNGSRLNSDISNDVKETAARYGVSILSADEKDLTFPGNLQEITNRVLAAERDAQAALVDARTKAETQRIAVEAEAEVKRREAETQAAKVRLYAEAEAEARRRASEADLDALRQMEEAAGVLSANPALLRLRELIALKELGRNAEARICIVFDKHAPRMVVPDEGTS